MSAEDAAILAIFVAPLVVVYKANIGVIAIYCVSILLLASILSNWVFWI